MEENISIGNLLRNTREKKKIKIEDVSSKTKININILKALESDDIDSLPNMAYLKGFVKNYARFIGLDETQAMESLKNTFEIKKPESADMIEVTQTQIDISHFDTEENTDSAELKENLIAFVQNFLNKKIIISIVILGIILIIVNTTVNWVADLNFESNKLNTTVKTAPPAASDDSNILKPTEANILEMDASKKFAKTLTESSDKKVVETVPVVKKEEVKPEPVAEIKKEEVKPEPVAEIKKEEVIAEVKKEKRILPAGVFPFKKFSPAPLKTYVADPTAKENNDPEILPPNFKAAILPDKQNVFIHAIDDDAWISYKTDDNPIKRFVLKKGRKVLIKGDVIRLFIGNYRVAKLFHNNQLMLIKPTKSGVRSLIIPQEAGKDFELPLFPVYKGISYTSKDYKEKMEQEPSSANP